MIRELYKKIISFNNKELNSISTSYINEYVPVIGLNNSIETDDYFHLESGKEHYRLLTSISYLINDSLIFDVGTNYCLSAIALSQNKTNKVLSYDIVDKIDSEYREKKLSNLNIEFIIDDCRKDSRLKDCNLIFFDAEHDGVFENIFYEHLKITNWKGILLLDDINLNSPMINFWSSIKEEKYDITPIGHWSGTGIVIFE